MFRIQSGDDWISQLAPISTETEDKDTDDAEAADALMQLSQL